MVEVHRQKWKALEEPSAGMCQVLSECSQFYQICNRWPQVMFGDAD